MTQKVITSQSYAYALDYILSSSCLLIEKYSHPSYCIEPILAWIKCKDEPYKSWGNISHYLKFALKTTDSIISPYATDTPNHKDLSDFHIAFKDLAARHKNNSHDNNYLTTWAENYGRYFAPNDNSFKLPELTQ